MKIYTAISYALAITIHNIARDNKPPAFVLFNLLFCNHKVQTFNRGNNVIVPILLVYFHHCIFILGKYFHAARTESIFTK